MLLQCLKHSLSFIKQNQEDKVLTVDGPPAINMWMCSVLQKKMYRVVAPTALLHTSTPAFRFVILLPNEGRMITILQSGWGQILDELYTTPEFTSLRWVWEKRQPLQMLNEVSEKLALGKLTQKQAIWSLPVCPCTASQRGLSQTQTEASTATQDHAVRSALLLCTFWNQTRWKIDCPKSTDQEKLAYPPDQPTISPVPLVNHKTAQNRYRK